jgi:phosphinothricin acetyltransferase
VKDGVEIRTAAARDLEGIFRIYDREVLEGVATFETVPRTPAQRDEWLAAHSGPHPAVVAVAAEGEVAGWAALSAWSPRPAYARSAESSVYVADAWRGRGIGEALMRDLLDRAAGGGTVRVVLARIVLPNDASVRVHERLGFARVGVIRGNGEKLGRVLDVLLMQRGP